jgi:CheY-like chemotaxis protein
MADLFRLPFFAERAVAQNVLVAGAGVLVALTGFGEEKHLRRVRQAGFDHHFLKPADPEVLRPWLAGQHPGG